MYAPRTSLATLLASSSLVPAPGGGGRGLERLRAICADAGVAAVLTTSAVAERAAGLRAALPGASWWTTDVADELGDGFVAGVEVGQRG